MRKKIVLIILCILFGLTILYLQFGLGPTVNNAITTSDSEGYQANLTITMNQIVIWNEEKTQQDLIEQILANEFKNMQFSYDIMGYPEEITVTVYTNSFTKKLGIPAFEFEYASHN